MAKANSARKKKFIGKMDRAAKETTVKSVGRKKKKR